MSTQEQVRRTTKEDSDHLAEADAVQQDTERGRREAKIAKRQEHLDDIDELLDEIDGILTEEREFLATYRQKGGQ